MLRKGGRDGELGIPPLTHCYYSPRLSGGSGGRLSDGSRAWPPPRKFSVASSYSPEAREGGEVMLCIARGDKERKTATASAIFSSSVDYNEENVDEDEKVE